LLLVLLISHLFCVFGTQVTNPGDLNLPVPYQRTRQAGGLPLFHFQWRYFLFFTLSRNSSVDERGVILIKEICWVSNRAGLERQSM
jgi:hypothetical protein